jgi:hypothetical protein
MSESPLSDRPRQAQHLEVNAVSDGILVYEPIRDRVHCLNHTAALVFELCTGNNTTAEIEEVVKAAYNLPAVPSAELDICLAQLREEGLIE